MFNPYVFENSRSNGIAVLEVVNGREGNPAEPRLFVPLKRSALSGRVGGPLGAMKLRQTYGYSRQQRHKVVEAIYRFPLPGDAAVTGVKVTFGEVEIIAELRERQQAEETYQKAKKEGRQATLATRESPDVFTLRVAGIKPDEDVTVETSYIQLARADGAGWSLRLPLTTAPRYVRSDEASSPHAHGQPLFLLRDPGHRFSLNLVFDGASEVDSPTHELEVRSEGTALRVQLRDGEVIPDRDCVLSWQPERAADRPVLDVYTHADGTSGDTYFLALVTPPAESRATPSVNREVIILVDHSGSMEGAKWLAADWTVKQFISSFAEGDRLNLATFHNWTNWFSPAPVEVNPNSIDAAFRFLENSVDTGGTELGVALEQALSMPRARGERACEVLVITDGQVSDEGRLLRLLEGEGARKNRRRVSVLCIDAAPNSFLVNELAERGGGLARFLTSSPDEEDISTALDEILLNWSQPVLAGLGLAVNRPNVQVTGRMVLAGGRPGHSTVDLGNLPAGRSLWVSGRVPRLAEESAGLAFRLVDAKENGLTEWRESKAGPDARPEIKSLFGARRVLGLEFLLTSYYDYGSLADRLRRLGYDPETALEKTSGESKVYAENTQLDHGPALKRLLAREALDCGLASSETAFVATRLEKGQPVEETVPVANAIPQGWSENFLAMGGPMRAMGVPGPMPLQPVAQSVPQPQGTTSGPLREPRIRRRASVSSAAQAASYGGLTPPSTGRGESTLSEVFRGHPHFVNGQATLFDSSREDDRAKLPPGRGRLTLVKITLDSRSPALLDSGLTLLVYVGDLATPRAKVRLTDLLRQGGEKPLNIARAEEELIQIVLQDSSGAWAGGAPEVRISLGWQAN
jgi:Ca-activated chloride channel homolog